MAKVSPYFDLTCSSTSNWAGYVNYTLTDDPANNRTKVDAELWAYKVEASSGGNNPLFAPTITINGITYGDDDDKYTTEYRTHTKHLEVNDIYVYHDSDGRGKLLIGGKVVKEIDSSDYSTTLDGKYISGSISIYLTNYTTGYTLTYNANGGSGAPSSVSNITSTTISSTIPTRAGHDFLGWSTSSTATTASYVAGNSISLSSDTTLYAVWEKKTYAVTYNANGGSNAPSSQKKIYGTTLTLTTSKPTPPSSTTSNSNSTFDITGNANGGYFGTTTTTTTKITATANRTDTTKYSFSKWNTAKDGSGTSYNSGGSYTDNSAVTLYAQYSSSTTTGTTTYSNNAISGLSKPSRANSKQATYTVSFNANGGNCSTTKLTTDKIRSYTFKGWGSSSGATSVLVNTTTYTSAKTVYAVWNYTDNTAVITLPTPTRIGYTFMGWATDASATSGVSGSYTPTSNITLYAIWKCNGYVYIYDDDGFSPYQVLIYDGSGWNQYIPYVYAESGWVICSG